MEIWENLSLEDMEGEIWKDIEGYEGLYQVSNMGRVKSLERRVNSGLINSGYSTVKTKILKSNLNTYGYPFVGLCKNGVTKRVSVHILTAKAFIPNPENKPTVDHINAIRTDGRVENLRWFTYKEQFNDNKITSPPLKKRSSELGKKYIQNAIDSTKVKVKCKTTGEIFNSIKEAARYYAINNSGDISKCCKGTRKTCGGMEWEYID